MKRFEMIIMIALMWIGAEVGSEIGIDNWGLLLAVFVYVVIVEIARYFIKNFGVRFVIERKEG